MHAGSRVSPHEPGIPGFGPHPVLTVGDSYTSPSSAQRRWENWACRESPVLEELYEILGDARG
ncbi:MAG: hypothetical protein J7L75_04795 [Thermoproteales archaeon]|nr:hypothetical protein [Thermoproteales archaeon]